MNEALAVILALIAGSVLAAFFFGGLWWTVRKGISSPQPALWFLGSVIVRVSVVLLGFYYVGGSHFQRLLGCAFGFVAGRVWVTWLSRPSAEKLARSSRKVSHAPEP